MLVSGQVNHLRQLNSNTHEFYHHNKEWLMQEIEIYMDACKAELQQKKDSKARAEEEIKAYLDSKR